VDLALDRALEVFWKRGYDGASLPDLTRAMGINRPSLYAAFGNKQELFRRAMERYARGPGAYVRESLAEPTARRVVERLLLGAIDMLTDPRHPRGCLAVHGALAGGKECEPVRNELISRRAAGEAALRRRFERAAADGDLPRDANPADLARFVTTVVHGMSVQAVGGATRAQLRRVVEMAMLVWPAGRQGAGRTRRASPPAERLR
jgi:AcrR family transcriptional regulator